MSENVGNLSKMELVSTPQATTLKSTDFCQKSKDNWITPACRHAILEGIGAMIDNSHQYKTRHKLRIIGKSSPDKEFGEPNSPNAIKSGSNSDSLIDPIWIAMLTLYIRKNKSMASKKLAGKFVGEMPTASVDRYFHFMHEMNLVETSESADFETGSEIKLTPRAVKLVEDELRTQG